MSNELATLDLTQLPSHAVTADQRAMKEVTSAGNYLPYLQILGSNTKACKSGEQPIGTWGLTRDKKIQNLGKAVTVILLSWRPKAMQYDPVEAHYKVDSPKFQDIKNRADQPNSGVGFGPEFLVWLPDHSCFATMFFGNKTARREAAVTMEVLKTPTRQCQIAVELIETKQYSWHGPKTRVYGTQITNLPPRDEALLWLEKFNNPPESEIEEVEAATPERG